MSRCPSLFRHTQGVLGLRGPARGFLLVHPRSLHCCQPAQRAQRGCSRSCRVRAGFQVWPGAAGPTGLSRPSGAKSRAWARTATSGQLTPLLPALQQLQLLGRFCGEQGIPFPPVSPSPEEQRQPRECHLFSDPDCPEAPAVLHFPLVCDSFREHSDPGKSLSQPPPCPQGARAPSLAPPPASFRPPPRTRLPCVSGCSLSTRHPPDS